ncbi:type II 3-dehydroquinate dehydratase [Chitinophaga rhizosphaerae]|uniref:type II 3-dehydroquinate dehydratase n=1 Tax=Chitinophaga rhizosphaerae TaxID=1864947 RepID=UPI000F7FFB9B|nr:type II 3-dehydroquinate dehydratase [Chitinophaga rhizosphaerae]
MKIAIINGPNLNLLGKREPEIYGKLSFDEYLVTLKAKFPQVDISYFQSNVEGEIVNQLQAIGFEYDGIILNGAAYTHYSYAIRDAIAAINTPVVEVHISNIYAREEFRHKSVTGGQAVGVITGLGMKGYELALRFLLER